MVIDYNKSSVKIGLATVIVALIWAANMWGDSKYALKANTLKVSEVEFIVHRAFIKRDCTIFMSKRDADVLETWETHLLNECIIELQLSTQ